MYRVKYLVRSAIIAAIYAIVTYILEPVSYGPIQFRISEALTILPLLDSAAIPGLFVGCLIANILGGLGPWDIYGGSLITLAAAFFTSKMPNPILGAIPPVVFNAFGVSYYLSLLYSYPYWATVLTVGLGEALAVFGIGIPLYFAIKRTSLSRLFEKGNK